MSETPSYSEALQRLEAIVAELERGGTDLEALRNALLALRGISAVELRITGVPEPALWERALNPSA